MTIETFNGTVIQAIKTIDIHSYKYFFTLSYSLLSKKGVSGKIIPDSSVNCFITDKVLNRYHYVTQFIKVGTRMIVKGLIDGGNIYIDNNMFKGLFIDIKVLEIEFVDKIKLLK